MAISKPLSQPVIVTVGNEGKVKNVAASVAAFASIKAEFPDAELHLFGPGLGPDERFGSSGPGIVCHGNVPHGELMRFLEVQAHLLIHPSRIETFGVILGEAKMRGVPVIAGKRSGGVPYVVGDAGGLLVDVEQPQEIAAAAIEILSDEGGYARLQQAAHDDAAKRFSVEQVTDMYLELYRQVIAEG